jgi:hypothetical protein
VHVSQRLGAVLGWLIVLSLFTSTVVIYASQNPGGVALPFSPREPLPSPPPETGPATADIVGWVLGPGNRVQGVVVAWTPPRGGTYALRVVLKDVVDGLLAAASCGRRAGDRQTRQDTVPFPMGPPLAEVSRVVISIVETPGPTATCS